MDNENISIIWDNVSSSMINFIHYKFDMKTNKTYLGVVFTSGDSYIYSSVDIKDVIMLLASESVGSTFAKNIKDKYPYKNIGKISGKSPLEKLNEM